MSISSQQAFWKTVDDRNSDKTKIGEFLMSRKAATTADVARHIGKNNNTAAARLGELQRGTGCIYATTKKGPYTLWRWEPSVDNWSTNAIRANAAADIRALKAIATNPRISQHVRNSCAVEAVNIETNLL